MSVRIPVQSATHGVHTRASRLLGAVAAKPETLRTLTFFWLEMNSCRRRSCALSAAKAFSLGRRSFVLSPTLRRREGPLAHSPDIGCLLPRVSRTLSKICKTRRKNCGLNLHLRLFAPAAARYSLYKLQIERQSAQLSNPSRPNPLPN